MGQKKRLLQDNPHQQAGDEYRKRRRLEHALYLPRIGIAALLGTAVGMDGNGLVPWMRMSYKTWFYSVK